MSELIDKLLIILILAFLITTIVIPHLREGLVSRKGGEWLLDIMSLLNHFVIVPLIQTSILYKIYSFIFPEYQGFLVISPLIALILYMLVDYGWYWNHRILHSRTKLWNFHMVHHAAEHLDVLVTPRNSFWSPLLMVYMWAFSAVLFFVKDPEWFFVFSGLGLIINFWGHTSFNFKKNSNINKFLSFFLITPHEHFWHHSTDNSYCNFGTVFSFWDRAHGTWHSPMELPKKLGFPLKVSFLKQMFYPFD